MSDHQEYEKVSGSIPDSPMVEENLLCLVISLPNQYAALMSSLCGKPSILSDNGCQGKEQRKINYLTDLPGASERLQIFLADLDEPESFAAAIEGCIGVFHLADPVDLEGKETEEANIRRSVGGTTGILQACLNSKTVKRVVYTSSGSTVMIMLGKPESRSRQGMFLSFY